MVLDPRGSIPITELLPTYQIIASIIAISLLALLTLSYLATLGVFTRNCIRTLRIRVSEIT